VKQAAAPPTLEELRECFEGTAPAIMATCARDGTPNTSYLSQIQYVDAEHVALSFQFFNKTRQNVLANPVAQAMVPHPDTAAVYRLDLRYLRTETEGPLFETMKAKLAGIASQTGMSDVFRLRGSDVYRVAAIEQVTAGRDYHRPVLGCTRHLAALRSASARLAASTDLFALLDETLSSLGELFGIEHSMILLLDRRADRLFTVASRGYPSSGAGSEIPVGAGLIGVAARERTPIRINHMTAEYSYFRAIRESVEQAGQIDRLETAIPLPGLRQSRSQLAVPIVAAGALVGVLFVESPHDRRFGYDDEDSLVALAGQLGATLPLLQSRPDAGEPAAAIDAWQPGAAAHPVAAVGTSPAAPTAAVGTSPAAPTAAVGTSPAAPIAAADAVADDAPATPLPLRYYPHDDSVFLGDEYLIKGVAGAVLWLMARDWADHGRTAFTNRELRLDPRLRLPDIGDNLEARLVLLQRRLVDRAACLRLERAGRGRLKLTVTRPLQLVEVR
jgi:adenylate cyclase